MPPEFMAAVEFASATDRSEFCAAEKHLGGVCFDPRSVLRVYRIIYLRVQIVSSGYGLPNYPTPYLGLPTHYFSLP